MTKYQLEDMRSQESLVDGQELQKRKKARKTRSSGTTTLGLDASQWLEGVNK